MPKPLLADVYAAGFAGDPRVLPGYPAPIGSLLPRLGTSQLFQKIGVLDTDWALVAVSAVGTFQNVATTVDDTTISPVDVPLATTAIVVGVLGTYLCIFNGVGHNSNAASSVFYSFYVNGVQVPGSERHLTSNNDKAAVLIQPIALGAGQTLDVRWHVDSNTGVMHDRNTTIVKIA